MDCDYMESILTYTRKAGYTNNQLCNLLGRNNSYISDCSSGKSKIRFEEVLIISKKINIPLLQLVGFSEQEKTPLGDERLKLFFLLDDDDKQDIVEQMEYKLSRDKYKQDALPVSKAM